MDTSALARLDSFPYLHRVADVMSAPPVTVDPAIPLAAAARRMAEAGIGALLTTDDAGAPAGIVSERDLLRAIAGGGAAALARPVGDFMSRPVCCVDRDALVHVAIARIERYRLRHLAVTDAGGRLVGVLGARRLLRLRADTALLLGDEVGEASHAAALAAAVAKLPALARALLAEGIAARAVAGVVSGVMRDATARAAVLAERDMAADGRGSPPAPYAVLVLGSAGRGESLLAPDQDNAIVHGGSEADDGWFMELGWHLTATLAGAGIPYCKGGVMASEPAWCRSAQGWRATVAGWVGKSSPGDLLNVDIFFDFHVVQGDAALADDLRAYAREAARTSPPFLKLLAASVTDLPSALGLFGRFRAREGRLDVKLGGLLPIVAGARLIALARGFDGASTSARLAFAAEEGVLARIDADRLDAAHETLMGLLLAQQLRDIDAGVVSSSRLALASLDRVGRTRLKAALHSVDTIRGALDDALLPGTG